MKQRSKRLLSVLLTLVMLLGMVPGVTLDARADGDVAQIGDTRYQTLQAALNAATNNDTVQLIADVNENVVFGATYKDEYQNWEDKRISATLDLNGHSVTGTGNESVIRVFGSTLTLTDSKKDSTDAADTHYYKINSDHLAEIIDKTEYDMLDANAAKGSFVGGYITGGNAENGGGVLACDPDGYGMVSPAFNLEAGTIIGNKATENGGGICIKCNAGKIRMSVNGNLVGNTAGGDGGGIWCYNAGETVIGAEIAYNYAVNGGGAFHYYGKFELNHSTIHHNTAEKGGGLFVEQGTAVIKNATKITDNTASGKGGGVFLYWYGEELYESASVALNGDELRIKDNTGGNLYLSREKDVEPYRVFHSYVDVQTEEMLFKVDLPLHITGSEKNIIGITLGTEDGTGQFTGLFDDHDVAGGAVSDTAESLLSSGYFFSDDPGLTVALTEDEKELQLIALPHEHKLDDADESASKVTFTKFSTLPVVGGVYTINPGSGATASYFLDRDVTGRIEITSGTVNLCLNGHKLDADSKGTAITVRNSAALHLCDCHAHSTDEADRHYYRVENGLGVVQSNSEGATGSFVGGYITRGSDGAVWVTEHSQLLGAPATTFYLHSGTIIGNRASDDAGGVFISDGTFYMSAPAVIMYNVGGCGGVAVNNGELFTMTGGEIKYNTANMRGGGVYVLGTFNMSGGSVTENVNDAYGGGGGVNVNGGTFNMSGGSITKNKSDFGGGVYATNNARLTLSGAAKITGNTKMNAQVKSNLYLAGKSDVGYAKVAIGGSGLTPDAEIGVTLGSGKGVFTKEIPDTDKREAAKPYFFSDEGYQVIDATKEEGEYQLKLDEAKFTLYNVYQGSDGSWVAPATSETVNSPTYTVPEHANYRASGYSDSFMPDVAERTELTGNSIEVANNSTLYVYYTRVYNVTYYKDAERTVSETLQVDHGGNLSGELPAIGEDLPLHKDGYYCAGWTTEPRDSYNYKNAWEDASNRAPGEDYIEYDVSKAVTSGLILYPMFIKDRIEVKLALDNGIMDEQAKEFTTEIDEPIRMLVVRNDGTIDPDHGMLRATREGYKLTGWYTKSGVLWNGENWKEATTQDKWWPMTPEYADSTTPQPHDSRPYYYYTVTLTAHWEAEAGAGTTGSHQLRVHYNASPEQTQTTGVYNVNKDASIIDTLKKITDQIPQNPHYTYKWSPNLTKMPGYDTDIYLEWVPNTYSITLKKNNGEPDETIRGIYGSVVSVTNPTREGYTFLGWSLDGKPVDGLPHYMPDNNPIYTARWGERTYEVGATVKKEDSNPVQDALVQLRKGNVVYKVMPPKGNGTYSVSGVEPGEYNLVVQKDGKTVTSHISVVDRDLSVTAILPTVNTSSVLEVSNGTSAAIDTSRIVVGGLSELAASSEITGGLADDQSVEVKLTVESKAEITEDAAGSNPALARERTAQQAVKNQAVAAFGNGAKVDYLDMSIFKTVIAGSNAGTTPIRDTNTVLEIIVPYDTGKPQIGVYRYHSTDGTTENGKPMAFRLVSSREGSHEDGTFFKGKNFLVIYAKLFSTYAIAYTATQSNNTNNTNNTNNYTSGGSSDSSSDSYAVTVAKSANGTAKANTSAASAGTQVTLTVTPASGYQVGSVTVTDKNGKSVPVTRNSDGTYRFNMPESAVTVNVTFAKKFADPAGTGVADWLNTDDHILYIRGYNENGVSTVRPDNNITRAEAAMMFYRLLKNQDVTVTKTFTDVSEGQWYAQPIGVLASLGIVGGYGDGTFLPNRTITRAEFAKIATRFAIATGGKAQFKDVPESHWASGFIATAADYGWIGGYEDGTYRPDGFMTRAAAAKIINYMLGRSADREYVLSNRENLVKYTDLTDPSVWYYFEIVEASVAHDFTVTDGVEKWK